MAALEKNFKINIPDSLMKNIFTVEELIREIESLIVKGKAPADLEILLKPKTTLWADILMEDPSEDVVKKIDLSPSWAMNSVVSTYSYLLYAAFKLSSGLKVFNARNIPTQGPFVLCPNHGSFLDGFLIAATIPGHLRKNMYTLGLQAYFDFLLVKKAVKTIKIIPIDPAQQLIKAMQACSYVLRNNKAMCIFPEGGRSSDGEIKEFRKGVGILAKELKVPLIPVCIKGSYEAWPRTEKFPKPYPIEVIYGKCFDPQELMKKGHVLGGRDDYEAISLGIREEVLRLKRDSSISV